MALGDDRVLSRRAALGGAAAVVAGVLAGARGAESTSRDGRAAAAAAGPPMTGLWRAAERRGLVYGTSAATWQLEDEAYARVVDREAAILFTEDDLLWYRLKPSPEAELDFTYGDRIVAWAEQRRMLVMGAHLVWDEGFGEGWTDGDLWGLDEAAARDLLYPIVEQVVRRYRGRVAAWIVVNEIVDAHQPDGVRRDYPWYETIGPSFIAESFRIAHRADPDATLLLNEFGFELDTEFDAAADRRRNVLQVLDRLLDDDVPVHALGVQAHLAAEAFPERFDARAYRRFLRDVADRGLQIVISELDVLDDGLPADAGVRDEAVATAYRTYLEVALDDPAVRSVVTFGLSDRYTWLQEDYPREDGVPRRPLLFDDRLRRKPAYRGVEGPLAGAPRRPALWDVRR